MSSLFQAATLRSVALANRIVVSPMCQYSAVEGSPSAWHSVHLGGLALGGPGFVGFEATGVTPAGRITPDCLGLWSDANEAAFKPLMQTLRAVSSTRFFIQLAHAGRKASCAAPWNGGKQLNADHGGWETIAPSAIAHLEQETPPRAMTAADMEAVKKAFAESAVRAARLGFDGVEMHAAHGYLLHQFLSPVANRRTDQYGGSIENRMRFPLEVFDAIRAAFPDHLPVGVRISATDWLEHADDPSWTLTDSIALASALKERGCDWIDVSSGGISPHQKIVAGDGYQVPFAAAIREATGLMTMAVGVITEPEQAEAIISAGMADLIALGRAVLREPHWAWRAAETLGGEVDAPRQYWRANSTRSGLVFRNAKVART